MFELLEHTADIGVKGTGRDLNEAFAETAKGMFSILAEVKGIRLAEEKKLEVKAGNLEELLVEFLNELLYLFYTEKILFKEFEVKIVEGAGKKKAFEVKNHWSQTSGMNVVLDCYKSTTVTTGYKPVDLFELKNGNKKEKKKFVLKCRAKGEVLDEKKHGLKGDVKAATYTGLKVGKQKNGKFFAQCILDV